MVLEMERRLAIGRLQAGNGGPRLRGVESRVSIKARLAGSQMSERPTRAGETICGVGMMPNTNADKLLQIGQLEVGAAGVD